MMQQPFPIRCILKVSVVARRCSAAKNMGGAAAPPYLVIYRERLVDALFPINLNTNSLDFSQAQLYRQRRSILGSVEQRKASFERTHNPSTISHELD